MGFASHLGPWLLGTVNNTGSSIAQSKPDIARNMGATTVCQQYLPISATYNWIQMKAGGTAGANYKALWLPAGALILDMKFKSQGFNGTSPGFNIYKGTYNDAANYLIGSVSLTAPSVTTTISADLSATATGSITVGSAASFPASGYVFIDNECLYYSSKTSTTLVIASRGRQLSTAAAHTSGATVSASVPENVAATLSNTVDGVDYTASVGTINSPINFTWTGTSTTAGTGYFYITYVVRNKDNTILPAYQNV